MVEAMREVCPDVEIRTEYIVMTVIPTVTRNLLNVNEFQFL